MGFRRFAGLLLTIAVCSGALRRLRPGQGREGLRPRPAPFARQIHDLLPVALTGEPQTAPPAPAPAASPRPPVSVVVGHAARKDLPWRIDEIGTAQAIASVALRTHFDATVEKVLVADGASVKAGRNADRTRRAPGGGATRGREGATRQGRGAARTSHARHQPLHRPRRSLGDPGAQSRQRQDGRRERAGGDPRRQGGDRQSAGAAGLVPRSSRRFPAASASSPSRKATSPRRRTTAPPAYSRRSTRFRRST